MSYDLRKYNFTNRVIPIWNSLSNHVVSAETVNTFKNRLDKFCSDQEVLMMMSYRITEVTGPYRATASRAYTRAITVSRL